MIYDGHVQCTYYGQKYWYWYLMDEYGFGYLWRIIIVLSKLKIYST